MICALLASCWSLKLQNISEKSWFYTFNQAIAVNLALLNYQIMKFYFFVKNHH